jgi:hypothetical protein
MESHNLPRPIWVDPGFIDQAMNIVETLVNLNYLTSAEAESRKARPFPFTGSKTPLHTPL